MSDPIIQSTFQSDAEFVLKREQYGQDLAQKKKELWGNILEFLVGAVLLVFCFFYLQTHPAEKISLFSGVQVMWQKVSLRFGDLSGSDVELMQQKFQLEKTFQEIVLLADQNPCLTNQMRKEINESYTNLKEMDLTLYEKQSKAFVTVANLYYTKVRQDCPAD